MDRQSSITPRDLEYLLCDEMAEPKALPLSLLEEITNDFSDEQQIGIGGFAVVYKGKLQNRTVAVKRMSDACMDEKVFYREVQCLMIAKHKNIVRFLGYCADRQGNMEKYEGKLVMADVHERLLCFEYLPKGSLHEYITDTSSRLQWRHRYQIIIGICHGLHYLHQNNIVHLDLKPGNILLDANFVAKIADFGLSRCFDDMQSRVKTVKIGGTFGYLAPEFGNGEITYQFDIYSLGVIIMEILTGKKGYHDVDKVVESWSNMLEKSQSDVQLKQVRVCAEIGIECIDSNPAKRPDAQHIIDRLDEPESMDPYIETSVITSQQNLPTPTKSEPRGGSGGTACDIKEKPLRLTSITIGYLGLVDAFSFSYIDQAEKKQSVGPWGEGYPYDKIETIHFDTSEFVEEVSGAYGSHFENDLVMSLTFVTNVRTYGPFGNPYHQNVAATHFRFMADEGSSIVGFHGSSGSHLFSIGVYMYPSNKMTVRALSAPVILNGQNLPTLTKSELMGGSGGTARDIKGKPWRRLTSLTISYLGLVDAFSFSYIDQAGKKQSEGPWGEGYHHDKIEVIRFGPSEFVQEVSGASGSHLTSLTFVTNVRTYGPFGNVAATPFRLRAEEGSSIVGFHGRASKSLDAIGIYTL